VSFAAKTLCVASQRVFIVVCLFVCLFRYRLSPETFGYTLVSLLSCTNFPFGVAV
jgi:hypothetical protein